MMRKQLKRLFAPVTVRLAKSTVTTVSGLSSVMSSTLSSFTPSVRRMASAYPSEKLRFDARKRSFSIFIAPVGML